MSCGVWINPGATRRQVRAGVQLNAQGILPYTPGHHTLTITSLVPHHRPFRIPIPNVRHDLIRSIGLGPARIGADLVVK